MCAAIVVLIGQMIGSIFLGFFGEAFGRQKILLLTPIPVIIGYLVLFVATSQIMLHVGFFLIGFGKGLLPIVGVFLAEIRFGG